MAVVARSPVPPVYFCVQIRFGTFPGQRRTAWRLPSPFIMRMIIPACRRRTSVTNHGANLVQLAVDGWEDVRCAPSAYATPVPRYLY